MALKLRNNGLCPLPNSDESLLRVTGICQGVYNYVWIVDKRATSGLHMKLCQIFRTYRIN